jgi:hypothetical protein
MKKHWLGTKERIDLHKISSKDIIYLVLGFHFGLAFCARHDIEISLLCIIAALESPRSDSTAPF